MPERDPKKKLKVRPVVNCPSEVSIPLLIPASIRIFDHGDCQIKLSRGKLSTAFTFDAVPVDFSYQPEARDYRKSHD